MTPSGAPRSTQLVAVVLGLGLLTGCVGTPTTAPAPADPTAPAASAALGQIIAEDLRSPWDVVPVANNRHLISERDSGIIWLLEADRSRTSLGVVPDVRAEGEGGLLGLATPGEDAGMTRDVVYAYLTTDVDNRVIRMSWSPGGLGEPEVIIDGIPRANIHNGGRLAFGPDGMLYIATGDAAKPELAQDLDSLAGKILRVTADGDIPADNPFPGSPVFTLGHRNVQGLAFSEDRAWASEFGTSIADELNLLVPGGNYGWPVVEGAANRPPYLDPIAQWTPTSIASPSGIAYVGGRTPAVYVASLRGQVLWQVPIVGDRAGDPRTLDLGELGRLRTVIARDDGSLWLMTSNTDGRGSPGPSDDIIVEVRLGD